MADLRAYQPSFTAGVLSPSLWARVDLAKYASGLKAGVNVFVHAHGGVSNRSGLQFIREVKTSAKETWLIPFEFGSGQGYILELGDLYIRVFRDGGIILSGGLPYEVVSPYAKEHLSDLVFAQEADVMYITHPLYQPRKLSRLADDNWTIGIVTTVPAIPAPVVVSGTAYFARKTGPSATVDYKITAIDALDRESAASAAVSVFVQYGNEDGRRTRLTWNASVGAVLYRIYRTDFDVGILVETTELSVDIIQTGNNGDGTAAPGVADPGAPTTPTGFAGSIVYGKPSIYLVSAISAATGEESLPSTNAPLTLINDMSFAGNRNTISWSAVPGAEAYIIYRADNGAYGYVGRSETTSFIDENITPDLADGPQMPRTPFQSVNDYPRAVTFIEQRLGFFSTLNEPQGVWLSQSASYENFGVSQPSKPSDAVTFRIRSRKVNEIRAALPMRGLMVFTAGAEWVVTGGSQSDAIAPAAIKIENQGYLGSSKVQPIVSGNTVLFSEARGGIIRDFSYDFANDAFSGKDLTILARHFFENRSIKSWAYAKAPHSIVWVILDDGSLVSLTYMKEHEVWAWTEHESGPDNDAVFESVATIAEGNEDAAYFIVRRTIGGVQKRYIERMHTRVMAVAADAFFVDSGLTYEGAPVSVVTGLDHLSGQSVVALVDGNVVRGLTVGAVTGGVGVVLPSAGSKVHVGLPMVGTLRTLSLDLGNVPGLGTVQGRMKSVSEVVMRVEKTRGIYIGPKDGDRNSQHLTEYKQREAEAWDEAIRLYTGDIRMTSPWDWNTDGDMWIKQFDPLPMTILAIMPDVTIGR